MKIKLLSVWIGPKPLPEWVPVLKQRMGHHRLVEWQLIEPSLESVNWAASQVSGVKVRKEDAYATYDLRPLYLDIFRWWYGECDWWGWMDLDVLTGDLDTLLPPLLNGKDIVTTAADYVHGPLTLLRNCREVNELWRKEPKIDKVLANPAYLNWDETGFGVGSPHLVNPSFTQLVRECGLRVHWDDRCWTETENMIQTIPSRGCRMQGHSLIETPTGRELLAYHFTKSPKRWPVPDRWARARAQLMMQAKTEHLPMPEPCESPDYWTERVVLTLARRWELHRMVIDTPVGDWEAIQAHTAKVLKELLKPGERVLDVGCSYGALLNMLPDGVEYVGVDYCPAMLCLARELSPNADFILGDLDDLDPTQFPNDSFDWAVCRGLEGTTKTLRSQAEWEAMEREMLRVAKRLLLIDMSMNWRVVERGVSA